MPLALPDDKSHAWRAVFALAGPPTATVPWMVWAVAARTSPPTASMVDVVRPTTMPAAHRVARLPPNAPSSPNRPTAGIRHSTGALLPADGLPVGAAQN